MPLKSGKTTLGQIWASLIFCLQFPCIVFLVGRGEDLGAFLFVFVKQEFFSGKDTITHSKLQHYFP